MLIKSQDNTIYNLSAISHLFVDNTFPCEYEVLASIGKKLYSLGKYGSEEDADEALRKITESPSNYTAYVGENEYMNYEMIYEMPKRNEV